MTREQILAKLAERRAMYCSDGQEMSAYMEGIIKAVFETAADALAEKDQQE